MESEHGRRHGGFFLIPAGALIGLGTGIITGYMWTGLLMGLGAGFLIFVADRPERATGNGGRTPPRKTGASELILLLTGIYIILAGIAIVVIPRPLWPYLLAGLLLLLGIWLVVRGLAWGD
jgi:hypothetical protein